MAGDLLHRLEQHKQHAWRWHVGVPLAAVASFAAWLAGLFMSQWTLATVGGVSGAATLLVATPLWVARSAGVRRMQFHEQLTGLTGKDTSPALLAWDVEGSYLRWSGVSWGASAAFFGFLAVVVVQETWLIPAAIGLGIACIGLAVFAVRSLRGAAQAKELGAALSVT